MTFLCRFRIVSTLGLVVLLAAARSTLAATPEDPATPNPPAAQNVDPLAKQVQEAIDTSMRRYLDGNVHTPWQIIHGILALRHDYQIKINGEMVNAIEWISNDPVYRNEHWFENTSSGGRAHPFSQPYAFEGHANQFLAYLTMSDLAPDHVLKVANGGTITIDGMVKHAQAYTSGSDEPTWTLWALSHYLPPDAQWNNRYGEAWSIERLVQLQTRTSVYTSACGGTHGLFALSYARNGYIHSGKPLRGVWLEADQKIRRYIQEARSLQNPDGMFSASYFQGRKHSNDFEGRVGPAGHTLEFLMMALPEDRLKEDWVRRGVHAVSSELINRKKEPIECAALYHALDALVIYLDRTLPKSDVVKDASITSVKQPIQALVKPQEAKPAEAPEAKVEPKAEEVTKSAPALLNEGAEKPIEIKPAQPTHDDEDYLLPVVAPRPGSGGAGRD